MTRRQTRQQRVKTVEPVLNSLAIGVEAYQEAWLENRSRLWELRVATEQATETVLKEGNISLAKLMLSLLEKVETTRLAASGMPEGASMANMGLFAAQRALAEIYEEGVQGKGQ